MPGIVEFPAVVRDAVARYGDFFAHDCQRRHLAEYLTGRFVAQRKTVLGSHEAFAHTTDQPCLNRSLTEVAWDAERLDPRRRDLLQEDPATRSGDQGVIPIDNTLVDRDGVLIPDAGWYWDHAEERNKIARDDLFINHVCTSGKHHPLEFRLLRKQEIGEALKEPFRNHTKPCRDLIDRVCERRIPGDFTRDSYFTNAEILDHIHGKADRFGQPRASVGDLESNRKVRWHGRIIRVDDLAASIPAADRKGLRIGDRRQRYFTVTLEIPDVKPTARILVLWRYRHDPEPVQILVTDRTTWEVGRGVRVDRHRGTGTETFPRDGKQRLGSGDRQLRDSQGHTRHMDLVLLAYSLLRSEWKQGRAKAWAFQGLMTIGEACRAMEEETLRTTPSWAIERVTTWGRPSDQVVARLGLS
jgi:hypothetical protein